MADFDLTRLLDPIYRLRYGVTAPEKSRMAVTGEIPGAGSVVDEPSAQREERRAAGFLFGQQWPSVAVPATAAANALRFWEDPEMFNTAVIAADEGVRSRRRKDEAARATEQAKALGFAAQRKDQ